MTKIELEAVAFITARRAELVARYACNPGGCEHRAESDFESGDPGYDCCVRDDDCDPDDYCDSCKQTAAAYAEYRRLRPHRVNALRRLERAVLSAAEGDLSKGDGR